MFDTNDLHERFNQIEKSLKALEKLCRPLAIMNIFSKEGYTSDGPQLSYLLIEKQDAEEKSLKNLQRVDS
ncbi:hypothetical protein MYX76_09525 [Desulfobacterota bacterium AH_259_B03_O07]|nr:hypothetical protein [Desulfobacterota bacterium AH_259_B03_O07]